MGQEQVGLAARAVLCAAAAALGRRAGGLPSALLAAEVETLRRSAAAEGFVAADRVCRAIVANLGEAGGRGDLRPWFAVLGDAIGCAESTADNAADACLAAMMVRMA